MGQRSCLSVWPSCMMGSFFCVTVPQPVSRVLLEYFCHWRVEGGSAFTIIFESLSHLSTFFFLLTTHDYYGMHVNTPSLPQAQTFLAVPLTSTQAHAQPSTQVSACAAVISDVVSGASQTLLLLYAGRQKLWIQATSFVFFSLFTRINK